jgi:hypothetical protein
MNQTESNYCYYSNYLSISLKVIQLSFRIGFLTAFSYRTMIASVRELDESLEAIKDTKYYNFLKSWVCAADAEFAYNMDDLERYEAKKQQAVDHYNLIISPRLRMRLTTLFDVSFI